MLWLSTPLCLGQVTVLDEEMLRLGLSFLPFASFFMVSLL
jgi:hypothetical protein